ncbi:MAG: alpha-L-fucosidase [Fimbriimonadaceae bacterium]
MLAKIVFAALAFGFALPAVAQDHRLDWFREARFGMFIHWGLYAVPAGKWGAGTGYGEWIRDSAQIPVEEYEKFQAQFNPTKFKASEWAKIAKNAGMKYVVITSKHHDGFGLFDSKLTDWDVMKTPFKRDIMAEIAKSYRAEGFRIGWYHSIMDWHHPDYLPRRNWETTRSAEGADFNRFEKYLHGQVTELLTNYGKIDMMWFDGEWERTWNHERGEKLYKLCRKLQPNVIVNNRVDVGRGGMAGMTEKGFFGDYGTPEQEVPERGIPGATWESCITTNNHWGYNALDKNYKSGKELLHLLIDVVSKGGNLLLNVGPRADGTFPPEQVERLAHIGKWMKGNSDSIYGTTASPFGALPFGRCTQKGKTLYLHVYQPPKDGLVRLPNLATNVRSARVLATGQKLPASLTDGGVEIKAGGIKWDSDATVIALDLTAAPLIINPPTLSVSGVKEASGSVDFVGSTTLKLSAPKPMLVAYTTNGKEPTLNSPRATSLNVGTTTTIKARSILNGRLVGETVKLKLNKVTPWEPTSEPGDGTFSVAQFQGDFNKCDEMKNPSSSFQSSKIELGMFSGKEYVGLIFHGAIEIKNTAMIRFSLNSDDGSRLYVDEKLVVDNDGLHGPETKIGDAPLAKGWHTIRVEYFNKTGGSHLDLTWKPR